MEEESFIGAYMDTPEDLSGIDSIFYVFRVEDFGAWYRRVRDAHEREVDTLRDETYTFSRGDKITQIVVTPVYYPEFEEVEQVEGGERGEAGIGSTGR